MEINSKIGYKSIIPMHLLALDFANGEMNKIDTETLKFIQD